MTSRDNATGHELTEDPFVTALVPDPSMLPDARFLSGFVGRSSREGHWRLYLSADLGRFLEFHESDVLHSQPIGSADDGLRGRAVWIKRTATLVDSGATARTQTEFLQGDVAAAFAAGAARGRQLSAGGLASVGLHGGPGLAADPTLFRANTCALSACISNVAVCTNSGQTTCDPAFCFPARLLA